MWKSAGVKQGSEWLTILMHAHTTQCTHTSRPFLLRGNIRQRDDGSAQTTNAPATPLTVFAYVWRHLDAVYDPVISV